MECTVCDYHLNGINQGNYANKSDSFTIDLERLDDEGPPSGTNSRIILQRSLSKKGAQCGAERKINDRDLLAPSSPHRGTKVVSTPEKKLPQTTLPMVSSDHNSINKELPQHQITIRTSGLSTIGDGRWGKRSSFKRSSPSWLADPKRILLFFATLSSMGTILLIYFTLSIKKVNENEGVLDWQ